ncbi:MAG TPA: restriction endonuclease subunit R [Cyanobacteria bacterium UBA8803]|nr:restriction endonuclease subunit R [Cyanobacteria bacterium UBA9273]HBL58840.1 restriction endonuclease subunit R [Cyanobacteria bacterium UBA8803]
MPSQTTEKAFENAIVNHLINGGGYQLGNPANFNRELALDKTVLLHFIQTSQLQAWQKLSEIHGETVEQKFIDRLCQELNLRGMLNVLRYGITDYGVRFKLAFFKPASGLNPDTLALYEQNILTVTQQVHYSTRNQNSVDLLLSINGLPVATVELKNQFTRQDVENAKRQYGSDRDNQELLFQFKRGALVHFAVDPDEAWMTTRIDGGNTRFLALIVDEAHSSQGGETSKKIKEVLTITDLSRAAQEESRSDGNTDENEEDSIRKSMLARGKQPNLSFFAFTATPKAKTLEVFGHLNTQGQPEPFHLYSMRQAIEEGFILDVLQNYTTYKTYFKLTKAIEGDPQIHKQKASRAIARFLSLHPHNLAKKTEIMVEHFRQCVMHKIGGKAKAMLVTASRPHVVRYKDEFDNYLKKQGYEDIKALVAFTTFTDRETGILYTESDINGFGERELPEKFETVEYQLLIVADKYQTGFDQPLLHTMYVDKKLSGVKAVQTLSRLNRLYPGKEDTFILDFANEEQEIVEAFQPYYEQTILASTTNPNRLYDLKSRLEGYQIIWSNEVDAFAKVFFKPPQKTSHQDHSQLHALVDPSVERFKSLSEEQQDEFKNTLGTFIRLYAFLAQIMPFADEDLEKFYAFGRLLQTKLPKRLQSEVFKLKDEVGLEYYRLQKIREGRIVLQKDTESALPPITEAGISREKETQAKLSEIIDILNNRFGTDFTDADKYFFSQIEEELVQNESLSQQAKSNSIQNFKYGFEDIFLTTLIERMEDNQDIFTKIIDDQEFGKAVKEWMLRKVYDRLIQ